VFRVIIINKATGKESHRNDNCETLEAAQEYISTHTQLGSFGKPEHTVEITPDVLEVIPSEFEVIGPVDISAELAAEAAKRIRIENGKNAAEACQEVLFLIGGFNMERNLSFAQKNEMKMLFADAKSALNDFQPGYAKYFINAIEADGVLVTEEMKSQCLELLAGY
jgi:hypothetical protein